MDLKKRLLRKPVQTILWQIILIAMALLIGVGSVLLYSSAQLPHILDEHHTTIATQQAKTEKNENGSTSIYPIFLRPEEIELLEGMDMVKDIDLRTLTGAYIPELSARIGLNNWFNMSLQDVDKMASWNANRSYDKVILSGTVEQVWYNPYLDIYDFDFSEVGGPEFAETIFCCAVLNIEKVIVGHEDYIFFPSENYEYYNGKVIVEVPVYHAEGDENFFEVGETYVVSGCYDPFVCKNGNDPGDAPFCPRLNSSLLLHTGFYCIDDENQLRSFTEAESTCSEPAQKASLSNKGIKHFTKIGGESIIIAEKVETSVEDLISQEHWAKIIEQYNMALHSFPVIGTQNLESMYVFLKNQATIVDGRTFSQEDYDNANKVCIISESVANDAGLKVGDTVTFNQFLVPKNYEDGNYSLSDDGDGAINNPAIGHNPFSYGLAMENESFTIAGIYRLENEWEDSSFSITPNTIFVPQASQLEGGFGGPSYDYEEMVTSFHYEDGSEESVMVTEPQTLVANNGVIGIYMSIILENGKMDAFNEAIQNTDLANRVFLTFDQGYAAAQESIHAVVESAAKLFLATAAGWVLLVALYVLLYQAREHRNLGIMRSVGTKPKQARQYLFVSGLIPSAIGTTIGALLSGIVTKLVQNKLIALTLTQAQSSAHSSDVIFDNSQMAAMLEQSEIPFVLLLALAAIQITVVALILWIHAALLSRKNPRKLLGV